ncbi:MAG: indole-3-glycerol phosphate synthase TrpC [Candidatus Omnitrophica bacterium]|nr:indole-3-glycerol phosphate synthase TrpC [Candidatus Omnitrophota bacterium]
MITLDEIVQNKKKELKDLKAVLPQEKLLISLNNKRPETRGFSKAISTGNGIHLIPEIKKASPSEGMIREDLNVMKIAECYENAGAVAISVLTESKYFLGRTSHISMVRQQSSLPVLRKDFIVDHYQILESAVIGCDAALLIAAILSDDQMSDFMKVCGEYRIDPLVEVHTEQELNRALECGANLIGINNRDLKTMAVDIGTTERLIKRMPRGITAVAESGFDSYLEIERLLERGVKAFLVGTSILKSKDMDKKIRELRGEVI